MPSPSPVDPTPQRTLRPQSAQPVDYAESGSSTEEDDGGETVEADDSYAINEPADAGCRGMNNQGIEDHDGHRGFAESDSDESGDGYDRGDGDEAHVEQLVQSRSEEADQQAIIDAYGPVSSTAPSLMEAHAPSHSSLQCSDRGASQLADGFADADEDLSALQFERSLLYSSLPSPTFPLSETDAKTERTSK